MRCRSARGFAASAPAAEYEQGGRRAAPAEKPSWEFAITAYPTVVRGGENYTSAIAVADHGPLHLEARYNYESVGARSAFVGWTFSGGEAITWELTPLLGGAWGSTQAFVPALEASVAWRQLDFYIEAEYVSDSHQQTATAISTPGAKWASGRSNGFASGLPASAPRTYSNERDIQRGPFAQATWGPVTIGGYWFNPGSNDQVFVGMIGATF